MKDSMHAYACVEVDLTFNNEVGPYFITVEDIKYIFLTITNKRLSQIEKKKKKNTTLLERK
jgi:hypothetical protein